MLYQKIGEIMLKCTITGGVIVLVLAAALRFSYLPAVMRGSVAVLSLLAAAEVIHVSGNRDNRGLSALIMLGVLALCVADTLSYFTVMLVTYIAALICFAVLSKRIEKYKSVSKCVSAALCFVICILYQSAVYLRWEKNGLYYLILAVTICIATDVGAYLVGKTLGKHKLTPKISPNKTVEGAVGGILLALAAALAYACWLEKTGISVRFGALVFHAVLGSVLGQLGDLSMSVVKRICGVKDFGKLLPGHGGILDRFDSQLFTLPYMLVVVRIFGGFFA